MRTLRYISQTPRAVYLRQRRRERVMAGLCVHCGKQLPDDDHVHCLDCLAYYRECQRARRRAKGIPPRPPAKYRGLSNTQITAQIQAEQRAAGLCICGRCPAVPESTHTLCAIHLKHMRERAKRRTVQRRQDGRCIQCNTLSPYGQSRCPNCRRHKTDKPPMPVLRAEKRQRQAAALAAQMLKLKAEAKFIERHLYLIKEPRTQEIMRRRHGPKAETLEQIGKSLNITKERVRQLQQGAVKHLAAKGLYNL